MQTQPERTDPGRAPAARAYQPPRRDIPCDLRLDSNEGARPPAVLWKGVGDAVAVERYPDATALTRLLARRVDREEGELLVTAGVDDGLERALRAFARAGSRVLAPVPTFEMIPRYVDRIGAELVGVDWPDGRGLPVEALLDAARAGKDPAVCVVVSPNNPTGTAASPDELRRLRDGLPAGCVLLVDAAYGEYADDDIAPVALELPSTVLFRTLSKAWGLAGLRVGYAVADAALLAPMRAMGQPYAVSAVSLELARRWLEQGVATVFAHATQVRREREELRALLAGLGEPVEASQGNFLLLRSPRARALTEGLASLGIAVRSWTDRPELADAVRITLPGEPVAFARLRDALRTVLAPQALLLDMDGVFADVGESYRVAIRQTVRSFGVACRDDEVRAAKAAGDANNDWVLSYRLLQERGVDTTLEEVTRRFEELYQGDGEQPGLRERERLLCDRGTLERLAARYPLAVVTGRPRRDAERFLERFDLAGLFGAVVCLEDGPRKPDPFPVRRALEQLGLERAWMVGDTPDDIRAAREAGVRPVGVRVPGEEDALVPSLRAAGAATILDSLPDLEELLP